jgi:hypothetical protein
MILDNDDIKSINENYILRLFVIGDLMITVIANGN